MPNGHGGQPGWGLLLILAVLTIVALAANHSTPSPVAQGLAYLFAALFGLRLAFYIFLWNALSYGGQMTSAAQMRAARRKFWIGSIVLAVLCVALVYLVVQEQAPGAVDSVSLQDKVAASLAAAIGAFLTIATRIPGFLIAAFGVLMIVVNWLAYTRRLVLWLKGRSDEKGGTLVPGVGPICVLVGIFIYGEPLPSQLSQWWEWWLALFLFLDIHTDFLLVWAIVVLPREALGLGAGESAPSLDRKEDVRLKRRWLPALRVLAVLAAFGTLLYAEQSWIGATVDGMLFHAIGIVVGVVFALLPVTDSGKRFLRFVFGFDNDKVFEDASLLVWALIMCVWVWLLVASAGSLSNRYFASSTARTLAVPLVAKDSNVRWDGLTFSRYHVTVTVYRQEMRLPVPKDLFEEVKVGETVPILATTGLWGLEVLDASLR